ncbi:MAG: C4-dicarboxylate ABC transporter substrate-binding protein [Chloroflexi bacterium]|nr:MAG: C4-dicarboxylate ABC transporter substrate-binding protein [Chloroflexota bacterium]
MNQKRFTLFGLLIIAALLIAACTAVQVPVAAPAATPAAAEEAAEEGAAVAYPTELISIMAPAGPGGGWDLTARAMQTALQATTGQNVEVYNVPGAGGTVGLAEFTSQRAGDPHQMMVMGLVMVGAIETNQSPVTLEEVTPLASLTTEWEAIVVPADSEIQDFGQLIEAFQADPASVSWAGGSAGGTDHILVGLIAQATGVDPAGINYIAHSGGGEALAAILSGAVTAGVSGLSEFRDQVEAGQLRLLAVSSDSRLEGVDAPTIQEAGVDVVLANWRAVVGPPGLTDEQRDAVVATLQAMHDSPEWTQALADNGWADFFQSGDEFATFLSEETSRVQAVLRDIGLVE